MYIDTVMFLLTNLLVTKLLQKLVFIGVQFHPVQLKNLVNYAIKKTSNAHYIRKVQSSVQKFNSVSSSVQLES